MRVESDKSRIPGRSGSGRLVALCGCISPSGKTPVGNKSATSFVGGSV